MRKLGKRPYPLSGLLLIMLASLGCDSGPTIVPVTGTVNFDKQPLKYGSVMFQPVGGGPVARGKIGSDGTFELTTKTPRRRRDCGRASRSCHGLRRSSRQWSVGR